MVAPPPDTINTMNLTGGDRSLGLAPASVRDYRDLARKRLPRQLFDYIEGGAYEEATMAANLVDLRRIHLRQRVMRDVSVRNLGTTVLGEELSLPVVLAPVGLAGMFAPRAEVQAARAAADAGVPFCESTVSICSIEEVAAATDRPLWYQLYVMRDRAYAEDLMHRAQAAGCRVLVLTVDLAVVGARYRDVRNGVIGPLPTARKLVRGLDFARHPAWVRDVALGGKPLTFGNLEKAVPDASTPDAFKAWVDGQFDPGVTWDDLAWVREHWSGPLALKGILDPEDAREAVEHGADAIIVSNHGGRQLDDVPSTITALPPIVDAVGDGGRDPRRRRHPKRPRRREGARPRSAGMPRRSAVGVLGGRSWGDGRRPRSEHPSRRDGRGARPHRHHRRRRPRRIRPRHGTGQETRLTEYHPGLGLSDMIIT